MSTIVAKDGKDQMVRVSHEQVLRRVGEDRKLVQTIRERQKKWKGHILRHEGLLKDVIEGRMEGKRPGGRRRMKRLDNIRGRHSYQELKERAQDREAWRNYLI